MTWKELKEFCNGLTDEQLSKEVVVWREGDAIGNLLPSLLEDDYYIDSEEPEEGCFPRYEYNGGYPENLKLCYKKGTPILWENI